MDSKLVYENESQKDVEQTVAQRHEFLEKWAEITLSKRQEILGAYMRLQIAKAIGISPSELDMNQSLKYLGIDSLIATKLRNQLRTDFLVDLAAVKFLDDFSLSNLVILVEEQIEEVQKQDRENPNSKIVNDNDWLEGEI